MIQRPDVLVDFHLFEALHMHLRQHLPLVPPGISLAWLTRVLDAGCGFHLWGRDLFRAMVEQVGHELVADVRIEGIDDRPDSVSAANKQIRTGRGQVVARVGDMFDLPADFSNYYNLVHARFLAPFVAPHVWSTLLGELVRVCKPGGWVVWTEPAVPTKGERTPAWNQWLDWVEQAVEYTGGSPSITASMQQVFRQAGSWEEIERQKTSLPLHTTSTTRGYLLADQVRVLHRWLFALRSYLLAGKVVSPLTLDQGLKQGEEEFNRRAVTSQWEWYTLSGRKL